MKILHFLPILLSPCLCAPDFSKLTTSLKTLNSIVSAEVGLIIQNYITKLTDRSDLELLLYLDSHSKINEDYLLESMQAKPYPMSIYDSKTYPYTIAKLCSYDVKKLAKQRRKIDYQLTILLFDSKIHLIEQLDCLKKSNYWTPRQNFYLYTLNEKLDPEGIVYTTNPFTKSALCGNNLKLLELKIGNESSISEDLSEPNDFARCNFSYYVISDYPPIHTVKKTGTTHGPTGILNRLIHSLNDVGKFYINESTVSSASMHTSEMTKGNFSGVRDIILAKLTDVIVILPITPSVAHSLAFDYSVNFFQDDSVWIVPIAELIPYWKYLVLIYETPVYFCWIFSILTVAVISQFIAVVSNYKDAVKCIYPVGLTGLFLGQPLSKCRNHLPIRILFVLMFILQLHNTAWYGGKLSIYYNNHPRKHQINNIEEIFSNNLPIRLSIISERNFKVQNDKTGEEIIRRRKVDKRLQILKFKDIAYNGGKFATTSLRKYAKYLLKTFRSKKNSKDQLFHTFTSSIDTHLQCLTIQKHHPLKNFIDNATLTLHTMGLFDKLENDYWFELELLLPHPSPHPNPLTLNHFYGHFIALIIGIGVCMALFVGEHLWLNAWLN